APVRLRGLCEFPFVLGTEARKAPSEAVGRNQKKSGDGWRGRSATRKPPSLHASGAFAARSAPATQPRIHEGRMETNRLQCKGTQSGKTSLSRQRGSRE